MKAFFKQTIYILTLFISASALSQKTVYENKSFEELASDHKELAIIPFHVLLNLKNEEQLTESNLKALAEREGYAVQNAVESYFLKRKKRKKFSVNIQDIKNTNALLKKHNITISNIDEFTTQELCSILKVDGLVSGNLTLKALISQGVSTSFDFISFVTGSSDYGRIALKISDGDSGKLLWKCERETTRKSGKNTHEIIESIMKKLVRKFPYDKE